MPDRRAPPPHGRPGGAERRRAGAPPAPALLRRVRLVVLDVDGVLTDGRLWLGPAGEEWKSFHVHDGLAVARALAAGLPVAVVSSRSSAAVARRCAELGLAEVHQGVADKVGVYETLLARLGCRDPEVAAMGDDLADLPLLRRAGLGMAPADAVPEVRRAARWVTRRPGAAGRSGRRSRRSSGPRIAGAPDGPRQRAGDRLPTPRAIVPVYCRHASC